MLRLVDVTDEGHWVRRRLPSPTCRTIWRPPSTPSSTHVSSGATSGRSTWSTRSCSAPGRGSRPGSRRRAPISCSTASCGPPPGRGTPKGVPTTTSTAGPGWRQPSSSSPANPTCRRHVERVRRRRPASRRARTPGGARSARARDPRPAPAQPRPRRRRGPPRRRARGRRAGDRERAACGPPAAAGDRCGDTGRAGTASSQVARLVAESERELDSHLDLALLLAVEARRRDATPDTNGALLTALTHDMAAGLADSTEAGPDQVRANSSFVGFLAGPPRLQYDVDLSADGRIVASGGQTESGEDGLLLIFDAETRERVGRLAVESPILGVDVSDDGRHVLAVEAAARVHLLDAGTGATDPAGGIASRRKGGSRGRSSARWRAVRGDDGRWRDRRLRSGEHDGHQRLHPGRPPVAASRSRRTASWSSSSRARSPGSTSSRPVNSCRVSTSKGRTSNSTGSSSRKASADLLIGVGSERAVWSWDLKSGRSRRDPGLAPFGAWAVAINPAQPWLLAVGLRDGGVALHDVEDEPGDRRPAVRARLGAA